MKRLLGTLRRWVAGAPLLLPLAAAVGAAGGCAWVAVPAACCAAAVRNLRVVLCTLLVGAVVWLQTAVNENRSTELLRLLAEQGEAVVDGTVVRTLNHGCLLREGVFGVRLAVTGDALADVRVGDTLRVRALPTEDTPPLFPGMFDAAAWRRAEGLAVSLRAVEVQHTGHPCSVDSLRAWGLAVREHAVRRLMPPGTESDTRRQVLCAMLLGAKDEADADTMAVFRRGGCLHIFAVSGLHVGMVAAVLWRLLLLLRVRPLPARALVLLLVGVYVAVTGAAVPALRAYMMLAAVAGALLLRRRARLLNTWCMAALVTLLAAPYQLYNAGFLLSFAVYAAICLGWRLCLRFDTPWFGPDAYIPFTIRTPREQALQAAELMLRGVAAVSLCAWLAAVPITACFFHTVNPYSFFTNVAVGLLVWAVMAAGLVFLAAASLPVAGAAAEWLALHAAGAVTAVVAFFGSGPAAYLPTAVPQAAETLLVLPLGQGMSCCVLGNPGVAVEPGNAYAARVITAPALFYGGFRPAALLPLRRGGGAEEGTALVLRQFPQVRCLQTAQPQRFTTAAGTYTLYPPAAELPLRPAAHRSPVLFWDSPKGRVLYAGNASRVTLETVPEADRRADVLVLGANPALPLADAEEWAAWGVRTLILLPAAAEMPLPQPCPFRVLRVGQKPLLVPLSGDGV